MSKTSLLSKKYIWGEDISIIKSLRTGIFPTNWKCANVTPIFKKDSPSNNKNYRPISSVSVIGKIDSNFFSKPRCHALSNALLISQNMTLASLPSSNALPKSLVILIIGFKIICLEGNKEWWSTMHRLTGVSLRRECPEGRF
jgi:hypothetical protein